MYQFRALYEVNMQQLTTCLNLAFSDYDQPICFTTESLKHYLTASTVDLSLSFGAFYNEQLVAVILNSVGIYMHQRVVFDAGTGVVPEHRDKKVFSALFEYTIQQLKHHNIERYYLEVLQSNHHAVSIYSKKGFSVQREYSVLSASGHGHGGDNHISVIPYQDFTPFSTKHSIEPSFEHTSYTINQNPQLFEVLYINDQAYCIYAKRHGEIIQMHYNELGALKDVVSALINQYPSSMAKNIDCAYSDVVQMLIDIGFVEITKQYEMARIV